MSYATIAELREWLAVDDSYEDGALALALAAADDDVTEHCGWRFDQTAAATVYTYSVGCNATLIDLGGLPLATTSGVTVKTDEDDDGVFETAWLAANYQLEPVNGVQNGQPWPRTHLRALNGETFPWSAEGRNTVQITGTFGWPAVPDNVRLATTMIAAWLWTGKAAPSGALVTEFGPVSVRSLPQAARLLARYRRGTAMVGIG